MIAEILDEADDRRKSGQVTDDLGKMDAADVACQARRRTWSLFELLLVVGPAPTMVPVQVPGALVVSSLTGAGMQELKETVLARLAALDLSGEDSGDTAWAAPIPS